MKIYEMTFSPTGGTRRAAHILTKALGGAPAAVDLTDSAADFSAVVLTPEDVAVIAVPSYGGRVPAPAVRRLAAVRGGGASAVLLCVYGNRAYEDTLAELEDTAKQAGFQVVAAVTAIAEHSVARRFAAGRPDSADEAQLMEFGKKILDKLTRGDGTAPKLPGSRPYKRFGGSALTPDGDGRCSGCGLCAARCPVQAIPQDDPRRTNRELCISCMRCVSICPQSARSVSKVKLLAVEAFLSQTASKRKTGELFLF